MSASWRQAGLTYIKYSNICSRVIRESLKPELRNEAAKRGEETIIKVVKYENGKPLSKPQSRQS